MVTTLDICNFLRKEYNVTNISPNKNTLGPNDTYRIGVYKYTSYADPFNDLLENRYSFIVCSNKTNDAETEALKLYEILRNVEINHIINDHYLIHIEVITEPTYIGLDDNKNNLFSISTIFHMEKIKEE